MLARYKTGRDSSGHSVHVNNYKDLGRPELVYRVFPTRDKRPGQTGQVPGDSELDCAVPTTRPMSRTETAAE
jgi:hypothetical protein